MVCVEVCQARLLSGLVVLCCVDRTDESRDVRLEVRQGQCGRGYIQLTIVKPKSVR
jgi:hypothetical protein